jgi:hypothetical protein
MKDGLKAFDSDMNVYDHPNLYTKYMNTNGVTASQLPKTGPGMAGRSLGSAAPFFHNRPSVFGAYRIATKRVKSGVASNASFLSATFAADFSVARIAATDGNPILSWLCESPNGAQGL